MPPSSKCFCERAWRWTCERSEKESQELRGRSAPREIERDPVDPDPRPLREAHVSAAHERERGEEVLAELAVGLPRLARVSAAERERVDENGLAAPELDVVRARVLQRHPGGARPAFDRERRQSRVLQLVEGPLVGIRDEGHDLGADHLPGAGRRAGTTFVLVRDQKPVADERLVQPGSRQVLEVLPVAGVDLPEEAAVRLEEKTARVAKELGRALPVMPAGGGRSSSGIRGSGARRL